MLIQQGKARSSDADRHLACSLAGMAGALNTAGFYAVGLYSSNMTGNVSALADHLGVRDLAVAALYLTLVATFVSGAIVSTLLINVGRRRRLAGIYAVSLLLEALLLAALGCADLWVSEVQRGPALAFGLSFLMGLQNAVVTRISNARVRTTHVTGMVTDIGIELGNLIDLAGRRGHEEEVVFNKDNLRLHSQTVASFLVGGIVGVVVYKAIGAYLLFGVSVLLLLLSGRYILAAHR
ncbi:MAG: YoaK family protein [Janthinobacterium lividum]